MRQQQEMQKRIQQQMKEAAENAPVLPNDPQLLGLHREFILKAEKLAAEYEGKKQYDRAREVYESLIRLVPKYDKAEEGLKRILSTQATKDRKLTEVKATLQWQDSGATIQQGMPVVFDVRGTWKVVFETGPEGLKIPDELKPKNNRVQLGSLIGVIATKPEDLAEAPLRRDAGKRVHRRQNGTFVLADVRSRSHGQRRQDVRDDPKHFRQIAFRLPTRSDDGQ